jgi:hypothetical protein
MQRIKDRWVVSPQDLVAEFECDHRAGGLFLSGLPVQGKQAILRFGRYAVD